MAPEKPTPPQSAKSSSTALAKAQEIGIKVWQVAAPILETQSVRLGHGIDWLLEKGLPQVQTTVATSGLYQKQVQPRLEPVQKRVAPVWSAIQLVLSTLLNKVILPLWTKLLSLLRSRLSEPLTRELSDRAMTVMILAIVLLLYWLVGAISPNPAPAGQSPAPPAPVSQPEANAKALEKVEPRLRAIADAYEESLVMAVNSDFREQPTLDITLSDRWYTLTPTQQNQFAADMLRLSQSQQFPALNARNEAGNLLVRNPVVGNNVIVLQRQPQPDQK
ncbi:hypothetical protein GS597_05640 [Synechococcales cyanobacterium C]|uniref:Uncharacterized protein n=1 Tax=Petrachloros mirabilis ULC683 TaxID=2781853 RepID=A0A8K1ZY60_9CYAN|nr:hypothetical protein [Petrachloros mirabilis]NCJ06002.1 hypothetical protein [Petrachloros mirabilis ULC683]